MRERQEAMEENKAGKTGPGSEEGPKAGQAQVKEEEKQVEETGAKAYRFFRGDELKNVVRYRSSVRSHSRTLITTKATAATFTPRKTR